MNKKRETVMLILTKDLNMKEVCQNISVGKERKEKKRKEKRERDRSQLQGKNSDWRIGDYMWIFQCNKRLQWKSPYL
jgi:hypothetical protein